MYLTMVRFSCSPCAKFCLVLVVSQLCDMVRFSSFDIQKQGILGGTQSAASGDAVDDGWQRSVKTLVVGALRSFFVTGDFQKSVAFLIKFESWKNQV